MQKISTQTLSENITELHFDFINKKGLLRLMDLNYEHSISSKIIQKQITLKFKCKPSLETLILHDFKIKCLNQQPTKLNEDITLRVTQNVLFSNQLLKKKQQNFIEKIYCQGSNHVTYLLTLIRSIWEQKWQNQNSYLNLQDVIMACELYQSQFQLQIDDLIEIFEAPLTTEYSRL